MMGMTRSRKGAGSRRGRALKAHPPPPAANASGGSRGSLVTAADLTSLAQAAGLSLTIDAEGLAAEADAITNAFDDYSLWKRMQGRNSAGVAKRDWCRMLAEQAHGLREALGYLADTQAGGTARSYDGMLHLDHQWSSAEAVSGINYQLERKAWCIEPDRMNKARSKGENGAKEAWWYFMRERMPDALAMLEALADRAADTYAGEVKRGGKNVDGARRTAFVHLAGSYKRLFGILPKVGQANAPDEAERDFVPAGPSLAWFAGLFAVVQEQARKLGSLPRGNVPDADLDHEYREIVELAAWALEKNGASDALAGAIRAGVKNWQSRPPAGPD